MLIVVVLALLIWAGSVEYCIAGADDRIRHSWMRRQLLLVSAATLGLPITGLVLLVARLGESARLGRRQQPGWLNRLGELFEAGLFLALGIFGLVAGFILLGAVLSAGEVAALTFGIISLGGAFMALRNHRRWRQELVDHGHGAVARLYLPAIPVLAVSGTLILAYGL